MAATPRKVGRPVNGDAEDTRRRILAAAARHFGTFGYAQATMKSMAEEAGLTSGAAYYYFETKERLLETLAAELVDESVAAFRAALARGRDFSERVASLFDAVRERYRRNPDHAQLWLVLVDDVARYPELRGAYDAVAAAYDQLLAEVVADAVSAGDLEADVDRQAVVDVLVAMVLALTRLLGTLSRQRQDDAIEAAKLLVKGRLVR